MTVEAISLLEMALNQQWVRQPTQGRLTREVKAELLGISGPTVDKMLKGGIVDRSTAQHAFRNVGIEWQKEFACSSNLADVQAELVQPVASEMGWSSAKTAHKEWQFLLPVVATLILASLLLVMRIEGASKQDARSSHLAREIAIDQKGQLATSLYLAGNYKRADEIINEVLELTRGVDMAGYLAAALAARASLEAERGELEQAKHDYESAITIRHELNTLVCLPPLYESLGDVETTLKEYRSADDALKVSLQGFRDQKDATGVCMAQRDLGTVAYNLHKFEQADSYFQASLVSLSQQPEYKPDMIADIHLRQALLLKDEGRIADARTLAMRSLSFWEAKSHVRWMAVSKYDLALIEDAAGGKPAATKLLRESLSAFSEVGDRVGMSKVQSALVLLAAKREGKKI